VDRYARVIRGREDLHDYQDDLAIPWLDENPMSALLADVGLGKAVMLATGIVDRWSLDDPPALVAAPVRVAKQTWPTEFQEWEHLAGFPLTLIRAEDDTPEIHAVYRRKYEQFYVMMKHMHSTPKEAARFSAIYAARFRDIAKQMWRAKLAKQQTPVHVIGIEQLEWLVRFWGSRWPYRTTIIDEASKLKNHRTTRWRALNSVRPYINRLHLATATPMPESEMDLFALIYLLDGGQRLGRNITKFRERFWNHNPYNFQYTLKDGADEEISGLIADICLPMRAEQYLDLEKPHFLNRYIELPDDIIDMKNRFEESYILQLGEDVMIEAINGAAMSDKLRQFSAGAVYDDEKRIHPIHDEKLDDLAQLIDELQGEPLMVAYWYQSSLARLKKRFPQATVMDKAGNCVDAWNAGKIELLLIHPASAGHGLNMQKGPGHDLCFFDIPWSRELYEQIIGRLARQGQAKVVRVWHQVVRKTIDSLVLRALADKGAGQEALFQYIMAIRRRIEARRRAA
jgi:SNF2 family DNA or RNA helicase